MKNATWPTNASIYSGLFHLEVIVHKAHEGNFEIKWGGKLHTTLSMYYYTINFLINYSNGTGYVCNMG